MTAFRAVVLEHFRRPRNRGAVEGATGEAEGANPLCGDRIRVQVRVDGERVAAAGFTADACAVCIAAASLLTERVTGRPVAEARALSVDALHEALEGEPPPGRKRCVALPLDTLQRALSTSTGASG